MPFYDRVCRGAADTMQFELYFIQMTMIQKANISNGFNASRFVYNYIICCVDDDFRFRMPGRGKLFRIALFVFLLKKTMII